MNSLHALSFFVLLFLSYSPKLYADLGQSQTDSNKSQVECFCSHLCSEDTDADGDLFQIGFRGRASDEYQCKSLVMEVMQDACENECPSGRKSCKALEGTEANPSKLCGVFLSSAK